MIEAKLMAKREHLKDYQLNEAGDYEYTGIRWSWDSLDERTTHLRSSWLFVLLALLAIIGAGFTPAPGTWGSVYVLVPYAGAAIALFVSILALGRLTLEGDPVRDHVFSTSVERLPISSRAGAIASFASALGELVNVVAFTGVSYPSLIFIAMMAGAGLGFLLLARSSSKMTFSHE